MRDRKIITQSLIYCSQNTFTAQKRTAFMNTNHHLMNALPNIMNTANKNNYQLRKQNQSENKINYS